MKEETFRFRRRLSRFECGCGQCKDWHLWVTEEELAPLRAEMEAHRENGGKPFAEEIKDYFMAGCGTSVTHFTKTDYKGEVMEFFKSIGDGKLVDIEITIREVVE